MTSLQGTIARQEKVEANVAQRVDAGRISSAELDLMHVRLIQSRTLLASCGPSSVPPSTATACSPARPRTI
jgi:hypothetical protein